MTENGSKRYGIGSTNYFSRWHVDRVGVPVTGGSQSWNAVTSGVRCIGGSDAQFMIPREALSLRQYGIYIDVDDGY